MTMDILRKVWHIWKRFGRLVGDFIGRVVLTVFYFTIFIPFGLGVRLFSDPLRLKGASNPSHWLERETGDRVLGDAKRQF